MPEVLWRPLIHDILLTLNTDSLPIAPSPWSHGCDSLKSDEVASKFRTTAFGWNIQSRGRDQGPSRQQLSIVSIITLSSSGASSGNGGVDWSGRWPVSESLWKCV